MGRNKQQSNDSVGITSQDILDRKNESRWEGKLGASKDSGPVSGMNVM